MVKLTLMPPSGAGKSDVMVRVALASSGMAAALDLTLSMLGTAAGSALRTVMVYVSVEPSSAVTATLMALGPTCRL